MLKLFKPKHRSILGIDISSSSVKAIEISGTDEKRCVEGYGSELLPPNAIEGNIIKDIDAVANCLKKLAISSHFTTKKVAIAVPDSAIISKVVQINDGLNDSEIEELVIIEADKYIPYPIDEINIDFEILGNSPKNSAMLDILIVASRAENVGSRVEAITRAGLVPVIVDVESYAVERAAQLLAQELPAQGQDKIVAVIDLGARFTHLFVLHGMKIIFTREEEFGGKQLIDSIMQHYQVSFEEAIQLKEDANPPADYEESVLKPYIELILLQVKRTLQYFFSTSHHGYIDHILLAGGVARLPNLESLVQERTGIATSIVNPFSHMNISKKINKENIFNEAPLLMVACGLALRTLE